MELKPKSQSRKGRKSTKIKSIRWQEARDIATRINHLIKAANLTWINQKNISCYRSTNANTNARARIWGLGRIWQLALNKEPHYIIEVISEKFDRLPQAEKDRTLLHELAHIPKNFSGAVLPHTRRGKGSFYNKLSNMIKAYEMK